MTAGPGFELSPRLRARGGGRVMAEMARVGQLGDAAMHQQAIADQTRRMAAPAPPFGGAGPLADAPTPTGSVLPPGMQDPITGGFKLPDNYRAAFRKMGVDPDLVSQTVNRNLLERAGGDYQQRLLLGQQVGTSTNELQAAKEELFAKTARAIQASPEQKDRILEATFTGPNADQLLGEFDARLAKEEHEGEGVFGKLLGLGKQVVDVPTTSIGQLFSGLGGGGDVVREAVAVLTGARDSSGKPVTLGDVGREISELPKDLMNVLGLGVPGLVAKGLRSTSAAPGVKEIATTMRTRGRGDDVANLLVPFLGPARAAHHLEFPGHELVASSFGLAGDIALDPTTYLTLGGGGLGPAATRTAGEFASKAKFLQHLGMDDLIGRFAKADPNTWDTLVKDLTNELGPDAVAQANDVAKAFQVSAESAHGAQGFAGYRATLAAQGLDADALFPRVVKGTGKAARDAARLQGVRGGASLRGGLGVGKYQARGSVNLFEGTNLTRKLQPGGWFQREGNRFHQLPSETLDKVAGVFHYGAETDRVWVHNNRGLFNATMEQATLGQGVRHRFNTLSDEVAGVEDRIGRWLKADDQNPIRLADIIEKQERSDYWGMVPDQVKTQAERLWRTTDTARSLAASEGGTDIPMLREALQNEATKLRYFPRKVVDEIARKGRFTVSPNEPGMAKARGLRAGQRITGPDGTSAMIGEGSFKEIQELTAEVLGSAIYDMDPIKVYRSYISLLGEAAAVNRTYRGLTEAGLLIPDVKNLVPGAPMRAGADKVRSIWTAPEDKARAALADAQAVMGTHNEELTQVMRERAIGLEEERQLQAELASYASRQADADSKLSAIAKDRTTKAKMFALAKTDYDRGREQMIFSYAAKRTETIRSATEDLKGVKGSRQLLARQLKDLEAQHKASLAELEAGYGAQREVLETTPVQLQAALVTELKTLGAQAIGGARPYNQVRAELSATRHRLAQVEGGELAKGRQTQALLRAAQKTTRSKREQGLVVQRTLGARAATLADEIEGLEGHVAALEKRGASPAVTRNAREALTRKQTERAGILKEAEQATAEAAELADLLDAGEAGMRFAELREGAVLAQNTGAMIDTQVYRMQASLQDKLSKLLRDHAKDLVAENNQIVAASPRLKFLNKAMREYSMVDASVPAIPQLPPGGALADFAQEYLGRVEQRGAEQVAAWEAAVGQEQALAVAVQEHTRQHSAMLAREIDLQRQLETAQRMAPRERALATHQAQGDELNMLTAELYKNDRELEWWMANRDELRKTQTLKSQALAQLVKGNEGLSRKLGAAQRLQDTDAQAASAALADLMATPGIFKLMAPEVEHVTAVLGSLPFMENGAAMPREAAQIIERLLNANQAQERFGKALTFINTKWKRSVLATPGSVFRRWVGNLYNATVLAGVDVTSISKAYHAMEALKVGRTLDDIADPALREYMRLAMEYNVFEGQFSSLATDTHRYQEGLARHPVQWMGEKLQAAAMKGEDLARMAQFIDGLDSGMGAHAARMWTGKFHFFNSELTEAERTTLKPLYPFYAYLRNNFALQFSTLFHQPGKISLYGHLMRDFSAQPEGSTEPGYVTESGGFPISGDTFLQNTLLDTTPLGLPQTILGLAKGGAGSGWNPKDLATGELVTSMSPALKTIATVGLGVNPNTGEKAYPQEMAASLKPLTSALQALGLVNDAGQWNPRALAAFQNLAPGTSRLSRGLAGGLTESQGTQDLWWVSQLLGPGFTRQGETGQAKGLAGRGRVLDDILASVRARQGAEAIPTTDELTRQERTRRALEMLGIGQ